ncbi:MAG: TetR/AcrR family transcriptional regulator C-terminal domain-containing protein [Burkholderiales bacterium]|nr:TetR/AcrR family transcriptional regulator C-terminal domain-containing protein [Burkholderiales bacterium]
MGRPPRFTPQQLQATALALLDAHGPAGLTMRALAAELGTGAMTIYNYVADREALELLVVEAVVAQAQWRHAPQAHWRDEVRHIATAMWQAVRAHPHAIGFILTRRSRSPAVFEVAEALLAALARSGRSGQALLVAFRAVWALVAGAAQAELAGPLALQAGESAPRTIERFRALPPDRFAHLIEIAGAALGSDAENEFSQILDLLLAGLAAGGR